MVAPVHRPEREEWRCRQPRRAFLKLPALSPTRSPQASYSPEIFETWLQRGDRTVQPGRLGKLPPELPNIIFDNIRLLTDIIQFSITCKLTLEVGKRHLLSALQRYHAPWAGTRLICPRTNTQDSDLPKGLLTASEQHEVLAADISMAHKFGLQLEEVEMCFAVYAYVTYPCTYGTISRDSHRIDCGNGMWEIRESAKDPPQLKRDLDMFHALYRQPTYPEGSSRALQSLQGRIYLMQ
ncbi:hypothetical protein C8Q74DRAFT_492435 [Fomes fomentarius]|nr:hypothetical protein C8Q74DRAFT_492435 [Fomes fomentarius]